MTNGFSLLTDLLAIGKVQVTISRSYIIWNWKFVGFLHHPIWLQFFFALWGITSQLWNYFVWLRITIEDSVPEMRIWYMLLIKSDLNCCIDLSRNLFLYFNVNKIEQFNKMQRIENILFVIKITWINCELYCFNDTNWMFYMKVFYTSRRI